jgi:branched-chain amino acid transport system ATP-binding protein
MSENAILAVRGLCKNFGALAVAQSIDLDLHHGARVGLIGPNGAGKTTFVNLLTGVLKPDFGSILLAGEPVGGLPPDRRVRRGLVRTHQINTLLMEETARDNVAIAIAERENYAWRMFRFGRQWKQCCDEAGERLAGLGLADIADCTVSQLPYGQQRLLEIAIALALKPAVLLLDEPAAGVPSAEALVIHEVLERLPRDIAILIIEHDMDVVFRFAKEIVVLVRGAILTRGTPDEIGRNADVRAVYLGKSAT